LTLIVPGVSEERAKEWLITKIDDFRNQKIIKAREFITESVWIILIFSLSNESLGNKVNQGK